MERRGAPSRAAKRLLSNNAAIRRLLRFSTL